MERSWRAGAGGWSGWASPALRASGAVLLAAALAWPTAAAGQAEPYPEDSPEHQALSLAGPFLGDEAFKLRNEYWTGRLSTANGRAVRMQFFKGTLYRLFLGVAPEGLPPQARVQIHVVDERSEVVAEAEGEPGRAGAGRRRRHLQRCFSSCEARRITGRAFRAARRSAPPYSPRPVADYSPAPALLPGRAGRTGSP